MKLTLAITTVLASLAIAAPGRGRTYSDQAVAAPALDGSAISSNEFFQEWYTKLGLQQEVARMKNGSTKIYKILNNQRFNKAQKETLIKKVLVKHARLQGYDETQVQQKLDEANVNQFITNALANAEQVGNQQVGDLLNILVSKVNEKNSEAGEFISNMANKYTTEDQRNQNIEDVFGDLFNLGKALVEKNTGIDVEEAIADGKQMLDEQLEA